MLKAQRKEMMKKEIITPKIRILSITHTARIETKG